MSVTSLALSFPFVHYVKIFIVVLLLPPISLQTSRFCVRFLIFSPDKLQERNHVLDQDMASQTSVPAPSPKERTHRHRHKSPPSGETSSPTHAERKSENAKEKKSRHRHKVSHIIPGFHAPISILLLASQMKPIRLLIAFRPLRGSSLAITPSPLLLWRTLFDRILLPYFARRHSLADPLSRVE